MKYIDIEYIRCIDMYKNILLYIYIYIYIYYIYIYIYPWHLLYLPSIISSNRLKQPLSFKQLLPNEGFLIIYTRNVQGTTTEVYKKLKKLSCLIMGKGLFVRKNSDNFGKESY